MYKRLLALLVFIPMFLVAWYVRNNRPPGSAPVAEKRSERPTAPREERDHSRRERRGEGEETGTAGRFDFYLLNLSWSPEFCSTHPGKAECAAAAGFVLHGLWPQNNDGSYPQHCSNEQGPAEPERYADLYPDAGLLRHEWTTHGTCSGMEPDAYFTAARRAMQAVKVPESVAGGSGQRSMTPEAILAAFSQSNREIPRESFALSCGNNYLTAVEVCLDKSLRAVACSGVRSCRANSVRIVPRGAAR